MLQRREPRVPSFNSEILAAPGKEISTLQPASELAFPRSNCSNAVALRHLMGKFLSRRDKVSFVPRNQVWLNS
jgi:hypothetical protein